MAENPVNPDADQIGRSYADERVPSGRAGGQRKRLSAAYVACAVAAGLAVLAALLTLTDLL